MWQALEAIAQRIDAGIALLMAMPRSLVLWLVPLAVVLYVATYFVMAIIFVILWKNGRDPTISSLVGKMGRKRKRSV
jgi:hypothetical protein